MIKSSVAEKLRTCVKSPCGSVFDMIRAEFGTFTVSDFCNKVAHEIDAEEAEMRGFCERVEEAAKNREDLDVFGVEYMPLPLDKNGEPWHVGDVINFDDDVRKVSSVSPTHVIVHSYGITISVLANKYEHYKKPTVESVLTELIAETCGDSSPDDETIAKYASKIQLKKE